MIKGAIDRQLEHKRFVVTSTGLTTTTAGTISPVTQGVIQGDAGNTRDGNQILLQEFVFRHQLIASVSCAQRVIVFSDTMADGATPAIADVLDSASYLTGYNIANMQERRFHIFHDEIVMSSTNASNADNVHVWRLRINRKVTYNAATNVSGANGKNAVFVLFISDSVVSTYGLSFELKFTDA